MWSYKSKQTSEMYKTHEVNIENINEWNSIEKVCARIENRVSVYC
jgi:hypothetical protein